MQTTTQTIAQLLLIEQEVYNETNIERYLRWCQNLSNQTGIQLQSIVANTAISNYYRTETERLEDIFLTQAKPLHGKIKYSLMRQIYAEIMIDIFKIYPKPLLEAAKKVKIINHLYN
ncbi:hypothetical protein [Flavobacterium sp.]|uniref:hypothetical protein n=1 Tax=Flavobacterium sp. TaxID=239 RepID=UPI002612C1F8|nr:hypothetical protein [Flavobacterium sp.]